jgi:hypothetical protein
MGNEEMKNEREEEQKRERERKEEMEDEREEEEKREREREEQEKFYVQQSRPGQADFKKRLTKVYGPHCFVTGTTLAVQAAHILPYSEREEHDLDNGMLLCADLHFLFDQHEWTAKFDVDHSYYVIWLGPTMAYDKRYQSLDGIPFGGERAGTIAESLNKANLKLHLAKFCEKNKFFVR